MDSSRSPKRRMDDETPRAKRIQSSSDNSYSLSERSSRSRSGRASPLKQMIRLRHDPNGLDMRELHSFVGIPGELRTLLRDIKAFADGKAIVSTSAHAALAAAAQSDESFEWASPSYGSDFLTEDPTVGDCTPLPETVLDALAAAFECSHKFHLEAT